MSYIVHTEDKKIEIGELFNKSNICAICNNSIESIEDANVDHIIPWSKGGRTILENAQITHEFCNKSKGNKEVL